MPNPEYNEVYFLLKESLPPDEKTNLISRFVESPDYTIIDSHGQDTSHVRTRAASGELDCGINVESSKVFAHLTDERRDGLPDMSSLQLRVHNIIFSQRHADEAEIRKYIDDLIELVVYLTEAVARVADEPLYVIMAGNTETQDIRGDREDLSREAVKAGQLEEVYWGQILPQHFIDELGQERVLSAPAHRIEELTTGAILLVSRESPIHYDTVQQDVREYLLSN